MSKVVKMGCIQNLCDLFELHQDSKILNVGLDALEAILTVGARVNSVTDYVSLVEEAGGVEKIEGLQEHQNEEIYSKAVSILENFFGAEEEYEEEGAFNPFSTAAENATPSNSQYNFGMPTTGKASVDFSGAFGGPMQNAFGLASPQGNVFNFNMNGSL